MMMRHAIFACVFLLSLSPHAWCDAPTVLNLSSADWKIHEDVDGQGAQRGMPEADVSSPGWIPATASSARPEPIHQPTGLNDGKYGNDHSWIGAGPRSSFQIDLGKTEVLGQFKLGRDRTGILLDRATDYLKIETSLDSESWKTVFKKSGATTLLDFASTKTMTVSVAPVEARFVRTTVAPKNPAGGEYVCLDEFEIYAPVKEPPGESRTISITAANPPAGRLSLAETGWRLSCWNADDVVIKPSADVLLSVGRRDAMCREFAGYFGKDEENYPVEGVTLPLVGLASLDPPYYLVDGKKAVRFQFPLSDTQAKRPARLRIQTADQSKETETVVETVVNGTSFEQTLPNGLGIQKTDPPHLAFPATMEFRLPQNLLRYGKNTLEVRIKNGGWFTWDSLDMINID